MKTDSTFIPINANLAVYKGTSCVEPNPSYHHHNTHEIFLFLSGTVKYYIEQSCYLLQPGDLLLINSQEMHRAVANPKVKYERVVINIAQDYLKALSSMTTDLAGCFHSHPIGQHNIIHLAPASLHPLLNIVGRILTLQHSDDFGKELLISASVTELMVHINDLYQKAGYSSDNIMPALIKNVLAYIEEHLADEMTLSDLQEHFFLSGTYISRLFKKHTGLTLRSYILSRRIMLAKNLLIQGLSVTEVCELSGFHDYTNFIKSFHNVVGISPGKFQKDPLFNPTAHTKKNNLY